MARRKHGKPRSDAVAAPNRGATIGHEAELWAMADALRGSMDAAEYKHVVLGLIFLKYISDAFEERREAVLAEWGEGRGRGSRRIRRGEHLLGAGGGPLDASAGAGEAADRRPDRGSGDGGHRARQSRAQGRAAAGLRPARARQAAARPVDRPDQQHPGRGRRGQVPRRAGPRLRVLPVAVRERRRQEGRRILHAALRRQGAGRDAGAISGAGSTTRAAVRQACSCSRSRSSARTPAATETAGKRRRTSASTGRSRTTRHGGSQR